MLGVIFLDSTEWRVQSYIIRISSHLGYWGYSFSDYPKGN